LDFVISEGAGLLTRGIYFAHNHAVWVARELTPAVPRLRNSADAAYNFRKAIPEPLQLRETGKSRREVPGLRVAMAN
jgi:hypothetical protein